VENEAKDKGCGRGVNVKNIRRGGALVRREQKEPTEKFTNKPTGTQGGGKKVQQEARRKREGIVEWGHEPKRKAKPVALFIGKSAQR